MEIKKVLLPNKPHLDTIAAIYLLEQYGYEKYPGVRTYYDTLLENARRDGYVETYFGRRRYIPGVNDANKTMRSIAEREAMNMPVQ